MPNNADHDEELQNTVSTSSPGRRTDEVVSGMDPSRRNAWKKLPIMDFAPAPAIVRCIPPHTSVSEAYNIIAKKAKFAYRHLPITDTGKNGGKLLGVVGLRNLIEEISNPDADIANMPVSELMVKFSPVEKAEPTCVWLQQGDTIETALHALSQRLTRDDAVGHYFYMSAIPIVSQKSQFVSVSIISFKDILRAMRNNLIPTPKITVGDMRYLTTPVTSLANEDPFAIKSRMNVAGEGQRDVPILDNSRDKNLIGLVPDHILITNYYSKKTIGAIKTPLNFLKLQTPTTSLEAMLNDYVTDDQSKIYYSFPVIESEDQPKFLGLVGYRDIFRALLDL